MNQVRAAKTFRSPRNWARLGVSFLLAVMLLPLLYYGSYLAVRGPRSSNPQLIAHRGGPAQAPENTLAAFRQAIATGADWLELDVHMTQDGELVVIHDATVDRTTNGTGQVKDLTLAEIRTLDAGNGERIPTFTEVVVLAKEAGVGILPETKYPHLYPGLEAKMVAALLEADYLEQAVVQSFNAQSLNTVRALQPEIPVCPLYGLWVLSLNGPQPGGAKLICPMAEMVILNPWMIKQAHDEGKKVFVWFGIVEHPLTMRFILALGADGLMVDDPVALAKVIKRWPA